MRKMTKSLLCALLVLSMAACASEPKQDENPVSTMNAGTYSATVKSMKGDMTVSVTVDETSILDIQLESVDTANLIDAVKTQMIAEMIEHQSLNVDSVAGATVSSAAVKTGVKKALEEAGADLTSSFNADATVKATEKENETATVVVVGSGAAGLSTAIMLAENGVENIVLLEKLGYFGGTTSFSGGGAWAVGGTQFNKNTGYDYDADGLVKHMYEASDGIEGTLNDALIRNIANVSAEVFNYFLNEAEVPFNIEAVDFGDSLGEMPVAWTNGSGIAMIAKMVEQAKEVGIDLRLNSKVAGLLSENGVITGVHVEGRESIYDITCDKVVLATGGFQRNRDLVAELTPDFVNQVPFTSAGSTGDGILMAKEFNAGIVGSKLTGNPGLGEQFGYETKGGAVWGAAIFVNNSGERFFNEKQHYSYNMEPMVTQPEGEIFGIGDSTSWAYGNVDALVEMGYAVKADTIEELATLIEVDADTLKNTIDTYVSEKAAGKDDSLFGSKNGAMGSLTEAPFFALKVDPVSFATMTGLLVDENCHILTEDGTVIENLYGAGELINANIMQERYAGSGSQVGPALYEGKIIADDIAESLTK